MWIAILLGAGIAALAAAGGGVLVGVVAVIAAFFSIAWGLSTARPAVSASPWNTALVAATTGLLLYCGLMLLPVPRFLSPLGGAERAIQNETVVQALADARDVGLPTPHAWSFALTRNRAGTFRIGLMLGVAALAFALAGRLPVNGRRLLLTALSVTGVAIACVGYLGQRHFPQGDTLCWWIPIQHGLPGPMSCFGNRNHHAGFLALISAMALGACIEAARDRRYGSALLHAAAAGITAAAMLPVGSRGALVAWVFGTAATLAFSLTRRPRSLALLATSLFAVAVGAFLALPHLPVPERFKTLSSPLRTSSAATRLHAWRDSARIWRSYPLLGPGPNAYRAVMPQYRTSIEGGFAVYPENAYVQVFAEMGLVGTSLFAALAGSLAVLGYRRWRATEADRSGVIPGVGAMAAAGAHAIMDAPCLIPLYTITLACLLALAVRPPATDLPRAVPVWRPWPAYGAVAAALLLLLLSPRIRTLDLPAYIEYAGPRELGRALIWAPTQWQAWYHLGRQACLLDTPAGFRFGERCYTQAAAYDPNNYRLWREVGDLRLNIGDRARAAAAYRRAKELRHWLDVPDLSGEAPR
jgi:O-antigen ligase